MTATPRSCALLAGAALSGLLLAGLVPVFGGEAIAFPPDPQTGGKYTAAVSDVDPSAWGAANTHDPAVFRDDDGTWYAYSTDANKGANLISGLHIRKSKDLIHWDWVAQAFSRPPRDAFRHTHVTGMWAPDVIKLNGKYLLYYCMSAFGTSRSFIGVAEADSPAGPFTHKAKIISSEEGGLDVANAIDPSIVKDKDGRPWMVYGSFFGGIHILKLDPATGLLDPSAKGEGKQLAGGGHTPFEGPAILRHGEYYYLFVSCGDLLTDYSVRVSRCPVSEGIDGTYRDYKGRDMRKAGPDTYRTFGQKVLGAFAFGDQNGYLAPGGESVLEADGKTFLVSHTRTTFKPTWFFYLTVHQLWFSADGWPLANPDEYAGETLAPIPVQSIAGEWQAVRTVRISATGSVTTVEGNTIDNRNLADSEATASKSLVLSPDGSASGSLGKGAWSLSDGWNLTIKLGKIEYRGVVSPAWDWMGSGKVLTFSAIGSDGEYLFGNLPQ